MILGRQNRVPHGIDIIPPGIDGNREEQKVIPNG